MEPRKRSFRLEVRRVATADALDILYYPVNGPVEDGSRHHLTRVLAEDETSAPTEIQVNVYRGAQAFREDEVVGPVAGRAYLFPEELVLTELQRLGVYFLGATASDALRATFEGYWMRAEE